MKKGILFIICAMFFTVNSYLQSSESQKLNSRINEVTIYSDRALITRTADVELKAGTFVLEFSQLPVDIYQNSVRVKSLSKDIKILDIKVEDKVYEKPISQKLADIDEKMQDLRDEIQKQDYAFKVLQSKEEFLNALKARSADKFSQEIVGPKFHEIKDIKEMASFIEEQLDGIYKKRMEMIVERRKLDKKIGILEHERGNVSQGYLSRYKSVLVSVETSADVSGKLNLNYMARKASWYPVYDTRVISEKGAVEIVYYGIVQQNTGEDWSNVELSLSTAKPAVGGSPAELNPVFLTVITPLPQTQGKGWATTANAVPGQEMTQRQLKDGIYSGAKADNGIEEIEQELKKESSEKYDTEIESKTSAVFFKLKKKESIPSDNASHKTTIAAELYKAEMEYQTAPRISSYVYLKTTLVNKEIPILPGTMHIFLDQDYIGESYIKGVAQGEKFEAFFGIDEGIKVKRKSEKKEEGTTGGFLGSAKNKHIYGYKIEIQNLKKDKIKLTLFDRIPVSHHDELKIYTEKITPEPNEKGKDGILKWEFEIASKEKKEIYFEYKVEYPKDKMLIPSYPSASNLNR